MIRAVPRAALALGLAGLIPFIYGAAATYAPDFRPFGLGGRRVLELYGLIIFAYMSGVFWGFAAAGGAVGWRAMTLSVLPAVAVFLVLIAAPDATLAALLVGFPSLLLIDFVFWRVKLAPPWWMTLRLILTTVATLCVYVGASL